MRESTMSEITIYHNPKCGTSRNTLALIRHSGAEPQVIEYLMTPPTKAKLKELIGAWASPCGACCARRAPPTPS